MGDFNLKKDLVLLKQQYSKLMVYENSRIIKGEINIYGADGDYRDSYNIKITIPNKYPYAFPKLYELENKFPHTPERHVNGDDSCCLCSLQEEDIVSQKGISIESFIKKYVIPFLANQTYYDLNNEYAGGEYAHGDLGVLQYYQELFSLSDTKSTYEMLCKLENSKLKRYDLCYCGSGEKLKKCHLNTFKTFKNISKHRIDSDKKTLESLMK